MPQDSNDEPAAELLKKIATEKERLVKVGEIKKQSALPLVATYEALFSVPNVWEWTRIGSAAYVEMGQSPPSEHYNRTGHGIPFSRARQISENDLQQQDIGVHSRKSMRPRAIS